MALRWHQNRRFLERVLWLVVAAFIAGRFLLANFDRGTAFAIINYYPDIVTALAFVVFPLVFDLTFGRLPFESLRRRRIEKRIRPDSDRRSVPDIADSAAAVRELAHDRREPIARALLLLRSQSFASRRIADSLYTRSGVYLIIGALIASLGLAFFYTQTSIERSQQTKPLAGSASREEKDQSPATALMLRVAELAPRFGILFFIEFIAFFFLRQYRSAMDEFRYFEAVKRRREELLILIYLLQSPDMAPHATQLLTGNNFFSTGGKLASGETTEIVKTRRLQGDELALFEKIIEAIGARK